MPIVNVDLSKLANVEPGTTNLKNARIDFSPYRAFADAATWVTRDIERVSAPDGVASPFLLPTPIGNAYEVQERGFRGARHGYVLVPDVESVAYVDLVWVDPDTLEVTDEPLPAWVSDLATVTEALDQTAQTATDAAADASSALTGLAAKVNASTYTSGMATKVDRTSAGREALALTDYDKLRPWYAALANRHNARVDVGVLGASLVEGAFVSSFSRTVAQQLAQILRAQHPTLGLSGGGRGFVGIPSKELTTSAQYQSGMWPMAFTGGLFDPPSAGAASAFDIGAKHMVWYTNTAGGKVVVTLTAPVTSFDIHYVSTPSGGASTVYYKIDGGTAQGFGSVGPAPGAAAIKNIPSPANTTVEIGWNATGYLLFSGITEYAGDESKGIQVHNFGHSGMKIAQWQDGYATAGSWREDLALFDLDLLILQDLMANDGPSLTPAQCQTQLTTFISVLRAGGIDCPLVLAPIQDPSGGLTLLAPWSEYVAAHKAVADADPTCVFVDHSVRVPSTAGPDTYGLYSTIDHIHPRPAGTVNTWMADTYAAALSPR